MRIKVSQHLRSGYINSARSKWLPSSPEYFSIHLKLDVFPDPSCNVVCGSEGSFQGSCELCYCRERRTSSPRHSEKLWCPCCCCRKQGVVLCKGVTCAYRGRTSTGSGVHVCPPTMLVGWVRGQTVEGAVQERGTCNTFSFQCGPA